MGSIEGVEDKVIVQDPIISESLKEFLPKDIQFPALETENQKNPFEE